MPGVNTAVSPMNHGDYSGVKRGANYHPGVETEDGRWRVHRDDSLAWSATCLRCKAEITGSLRELDDNMKAHVATCNGVTGVPS